MHNTGNNRQRYKLERMCDNCPFDTHGDGAALRLTLRPERWAGILLGLVRGGHFLCHKTTLAGKEDEEGNLIPSGNERICAGSRQFQATFGIVSDVEQIMERLIKIREQSKQSIGGTDHE